MKTFRSFWEIEKDAQGRTWPSPPEIFPAWLVELTPIRANGNPDPELAQIVIVHGRDDLDASRMAFATRNIPDNWIVTEIERV